ncbi:MAG: hypothetical protein DIU70_011680, partial [Bacillota bacterium]
MRREEGSGRAVRQGEQSPGARLDAALRPFARRVRGRWLAEGLRAALTWGLASAFLPLLAYRTVGWATGGAGWAWLLHPLVLAGAAFLAGFAGAAAVWLRRPPGPGEVALAVDGLGLEERVTSAWYALVSRHPAAPLLEREALEALARLDPRDYPVVPSWRRWRGVGILAAALLVLPLLPNPAAERAQARARELEAVARARAEVAALAARWEGALPPEAVPLSESVRARLDELLRELNRAEGAAEAAAAVAAAREELARLPSPEDVARAQTLSRLAQAWASQPRLAAVARALAARDPAGVRAAVAELAREAAAAPAEERQELALALQAAANESRGVPDLAAAFREAARELAAGPGEGGEGAEGPGGSAGESPAGEESDLVGLGEALADLAAGAAGLQALVDQVGALAALEAGLSAGGAGVAPGAGAVAGGGAPAGGAAGGA